MRNTIYGLAYALKITLATGALLALAILFASSGIFGSANPVGVAMFLGALLGIPAALLFFLGLLGLAAKDPHAEKAETHAMSDREAGTCPNCEATLCLSVLECPICGAQFNEYASWSIQRAQDSPKSTHA